MIDLRKHVALGRTLPLVLGALALSAAGCGSNEGGEGGGSPSGTTGTMDMPACADDPRVQVYTVGLSSTSADGSIKITFVDADPAPPAKGDNTWMLQVVDEAGAPVNGADIATTEYMPDHGHYSPINPTATPMDSDGTYEVTPVNLFMPGVWEVTLAVTPTGGNPTPVKFTFCVEG